MHFIQARELMGSSIFTASVSPFLNHTIQHKIEQKTIDQSSITSKRSKIQSPIYKRGKKKIIASVYLYWYSLYFNSKSGFHH